MPASAVVRPEEQYATLAQQSDAAQLGIWAFLVNETIFFGSLLFVYFLYRWTYSHQFALAAKDTVLWCGTVNFVLLLTSSLTMAFAVAAAERRDSERTLRWLAVTFALGLAFVLVKGYEYYLDYGDKVLPVFHYAAKPGETPAAELFWVFYWVATALHAIHLSIGLGLLGYLMLWRVRRGGVSAGYYAPVEVIGVYWSFVDTVWLFLYPALYLVSR